MEAVQRVPLIDFSRNESSEISQPASKSKSTSLSHPRCWVIFRRSHHFFIFSGVFNDSKGGDNAINEFTVALYVDIIIVIDIAQFESIHR